MGDLFDDMANAEVEAPPVSGGQDMPDKLRLVVENATAESGGAAPKIKPYGADENLFYKFETGLLVVGGVKEATPFKGRYIFVGFNTHKPTEARVQSWIDNSVDARARERQEGLLKSLPKLPLGAEVYNMILDMLAPSSADVKERWQTAFATISKMKNLKGYTTEMFSGDIQLMIATCFKDILLDQKFQVIGQTYTPKKNEKSTYEPRQTLGSIEACTPAQMAKRKVSLFVSDF